MTRRISADTLINILSQVGHEVVLPRWKAISTSEVEEKGPDELVTQVDRDAETRLAELLGKALPGSSVIGEESVTANPDMLNVLRAPEPVWIVDPIDGTANYAEGREPFAIMAGLLIEAEPVMGAIYEPASGALTVAESGAGTYFNGQRITIPEQSRVLSDMRGSALFRHFPGVHQETLKRGTGGCGRLGAGHYCAGREYPDVLRGNLDFAMFWRAYPWDHIPGSLMLREAGGEVFRYDGQPYDHLSQTPGLVAVRNPHYFEAIRRSLVA